MGKFPLQVAYLRVAFLHVVPVALLHMVPGIDTGFFARGGNGMRHSREVACSVEA